jgi:glycosyltransferase involved in cell wall biosynthesis
MTVAFDVGPLKPNPAGVGMYVQSLAEGFAEIGQSDLVYIGRRPEARGLPSGVPSIARSPRLPYSLWVELLAVNAVRRSGARAAHFTDGLVPVFRSRPTVVTVLDLSLVRHWRAHRAPRYLRIPFILAAPRLADRVIAISRATADEVIRLTGTSARKIDVIPLAPRHSVAQPPAEVVAQVLRRHGLDRESYLLAPGTIEPRKNHIRLVRAFEALIQRGAIPVEMQLVIAGQPGWKAAKTVAIIAASSAASRIKLLGYVPDEELAALMTAAAVVVYVSTYEGFGLPVVEAMACGAAVVTSNVSSMPEAAGGAGVLVDPFDPSAIADGIQSALAGGAAARREALARAARSTWRDVAEHTAATYALLE